MKPFLSMIPAITGSVILRQSARMSERVEVISVAGQRLLMFRQAAAMLFL